MVVVKALACFDDVKSHAGGSIDTRRATQARQVSTEKPYLKCPSIIRYDEEK